MDFSINDYLIEQKNIEWSTALSNWAWLIPEEFTLWLVNRFADLFLVLDDGSVHMLDVGIGTFVKVAENRDDFMDKLDRNADSWMMPHLVDSLVASGIVLKEGQCYGFRTPPVVGGEYSVANCVPQRILEYLRFCSSIHEQLQVVPDGKFVVLKVDRKPD